MGGFDGIYLVFASFIGSGVDSDGGIVFGIYGDPNLGASDLSLYDFNDGKPVVALIDESLE